MASTTRRLAAILAADIAGYSRLMGADEVGTVEALREHRSAAYPFIAQHGGRVVKTTGDGVLIEFGSAVGSVECALALQRLAAERNAGTPFERHMEWRIGIHVGDVLIEGDDILGDGVNIAARLEGIAKPGGICISEDAFRQVRGKVEVEFADLGEQSLKNIARPLRVYRVGSSSAARQPISSAAALPLPDKPAIAVLPFANISGDPEQEYFADGMVEEIITALSRIRWLFVIARNSSFAYKGRSVDVKQVGWELGVRYVLEGSVRKAGGRVRITAQLIDAQSSAHLWADRFEGALEDVFDLQDTVASSVAGVIEPALQAAETARSSGRPTSDLTAYDLYLRALPLPLLVTRESIGEALDLLGRAIDRDPRYGPALAQAAFCHSVIGFSGWGDFESERREGSALARRALECAGDDPNVIAWAAIALANLKENINFTKGLVTSALTRNPSSSIAWLMSGWLKLFAGDDTDRAIQDLQQSLRLDPLTTRRAAHLTGMGSAHLFQRRFEEAAAALEASLSEAPSYVTTQWLLTACYGLMGRPKDAQDLIARFDLRMADIQYDIDLFRDPEHRELCRSGLRLAAGEAT
jgi:adenylate cyclase